MIIATVIRITLSLGLCWMVYKETGPWTAIFALLSLASTECLNQYMGGVLKVSKK